MTFQRDVGNDFTRERIGSIYLFMSKMPHETGRNTRKFHSYISYFKFGPLCQQQKTIFRVEFKKPNSRWSNFAVYRTLKNAWNNPCLHLRKLVNIRKILKLHGDTAYYPVSHAEIMFLHWHAKISKNRYQSFLVLSKFA